MSKTQGSRLGTLVSNLRVGTRKGVPTYGAERWQSGESPDRTCDLTLSTLRHPEHIASP